MTEPTTATPTAEALDALIAKLPDELRPLAIKYGPVVMAWSAAQAWAWVELLAAGDWQTAYRTLVEGLPDVRLAEEWAAVNADLAGANIRAAASAAFFREACMGILGGVLRMVLLTVGL